MLSPATTVVFANIPSQPTSLTLKAKASPATIQVSWAAPTLTNGASIDGYSVYVDDGLGGPFVKVFDGISYPSTYSYLITNLRCGLPHIVRVTATNSAGEGPYASESIYLGEVPSYPLNPFLQSVTPQSPLTYGWQAPLSDGCLAILSYTVNKDGADYALGLNPTATRFIDDISVGGNIGEKITYKIKAVNYAGESPYCEPLTVTVGLVPSAPTGLVINKIISQTDT